MGIWTRVRGWRGRSRVAKVDSYTRWTLYLLPCLLPVLAESPMLVHGLDRPWLLAQGGVCLLQGLVGIPVFRRCLDHYLWDKPAPWWGMAGQTVLFLVGLACMVVSFSVESPQSSSTVGVFLMNSALSTFGALSLMVRLRRYVMGCVAVALGLGLLVLLPGGGWSTAGVLVAGVLFMSLWCASVGRASGWMLRVMWELETARDAKARLAVAEERLRFGRDLHDVLGRNLAVIALKSELAVQLGRRGAPQALELMAEVQGIARDSQREVREVVRGYREADLPTELAGARSVLSAAGIECRIDDSARGQLPAPVQSALAWVVREATTNVLRHADAGRCAVRLRIVEEVAVLVMENDGAPVPGAPTGGSGPDGSLPGASPSGGSSSGGSSSGGSGLAGLGERLAVLDGTVTAERRPPAVFRLTARVPLARGSAAEAPSAGAPFAGVPSAGGQAGNLSAEVPAAGTGAGGTLSAKAPSAATSGGAGVATGTATADGEPGRPGAGRGKPALGRGASDRRGDGQPVAVGAGRVSGTPDEATGADGGAA
ncbi:sensor histidine kinase [Streptomyces eurocidicus]|uniref:Two-component system sensor histidine kinase DesK n=1 Tax=Streptomyces eurocidicus TaxID=66423 RepID=A0A7W8BDL9_STREU|nr:histidine kinase [Streptomyces eurocidicus]MBB5121440.1 two-component system sensor histidine kinase DesK [Streptomyces eurocidicus]